MDSKQLEKIFTYHPPQVGQPERYVMIRQEALRLALIINAQCPESREKSLAITAIQQAVQMANAAIAIHKHKEN